MQTLRLRMQFFHDSRCMGGRHLGEHGMHCFHDCWMDCVIEEDGFEEMVLLLHREQHEQVFGSD